VLLLLLQGQVGSCASILDYIFTILFMRLGVGR